MSNPSYNEPNGQDKAQECVADADDRTFRVARARVKARRLGFALEEQGDTGRYLLLEGDARVPVVLGDLTLDALEDFVDALIWETAP